MTLLSRYAYLCAIFFGLVVSGCTTPGTAVIENQDRSIQDLSAIVIAALPVGKASVSQNGRTFTSVYFASKGGEFVEGNEAPVRAKAIIVILGDRRPYNIEVTVIQEKKTNTASYNRIENSDGLARVVIRRIQKALHERRDNRNVIDDFRVF